MRVIGSGIVEGSLQAVYRVRLLITLHLLSEGFQDKRNGPRTVQHWGLFCYSLRYSPVAAVGYRLPRQIYHGFLHKSRGVPLTQVRFWLYLKRKGIKKYRTLTD